MVMLKIAQGLEPGRADGLGRISGGGCELEEIASRNQYGSK